MIKENQETLEQDEKTHRFEISWNRLKTGKKWYKEWWLSLGISWDTTDYTPPYKRVVTIGIIFFSIYIRY